MAEELVFIRCGDIVLEALAELRTGDQGVVMTHPHPLYGGNMYHPVVEAVLAAYGFLGYSTLRFNFRGVGQSQGVYNEGIGEEQDIQAALEYLTQKGKTRLELGGYSFGAWVSARGLKNWRQVKRLVMISPPVAFMPFDSLFSDPRIQLIVAADEDEIAPPKQIEKQMRIWNPESVLKIIRGTDHFYGGKSKAITQLVQDFLTGCDG